MLRNRPIALVLFAFTAGVATGLFFDIWISFAAGVVIWSVTMLVRPAKKYRSMLIFSVLALIAGSIYSDVYVSLFALPKVESGKDYGFYAYVTEVREMQNGTRVSAKVYDDSSPFDGCKVYVYCDEAPPCGCVASVYGSMSLANFTSRGDGIDYYVNGSAVICEGRTANGIYVTLNKIRQSVSNVILQSFPSSSAGFYGALITGDRSGLDDAANALFSRAGISHVIAISGQHFSIIIYTIYTFLRRTLKKRRTCGAICIALSLLYTLFVGASPSVVRACIMCCATFGASLFSVRYDTFTALMGALALIVAASPYAVASVGLQLSFLSTAGIIIVLNISENSRRKNTKAFRILWSPLLLSVAATVCCLPIFVITFDYISLSGPITNILVNLLITPAMITGILITALLSVFPWLWITAYIPDLLYGVIAGIADFAVSLPWATVSAYLPHIAWMALPAVAAPVLCVILSKKRALIAACVCLLSAALITVGCIALYDADIGANGLLVVCSDGNDSYVFAADGHATVLVDIAGNSDCVDMIVEYGFTELDGYVILNYSENSLYRLEHLLYYIHVDILYMPSEGKSAVYSDIFEGKVNNLHFYERDVLTVGGLEICVPERDSDYTEYMINADCNGTSVTVMGGCVSLSGYAAERVDCLIITEDCLATECDYRMLPYRYGMLYMPDYTESVFTMHLEENAKAAGSYSDTVALRYGKDGITRVE